MASTLITGPPGSGKTITSRLLAERTPRGVHIAADHFWRMIVSGYIKPWKPEARAQNVTAIVATAAAAVEYALGGYDVITDGIIGPWHLEPFAAAHAAAGIPLALVILRPPLETALARAAARGKNGLADEEPVAHMHQQFNGLDAYERYVIDNAELDAEQTADVISDRIASGELTLA